MSDSTSPPSDNKEPMQSAHGGISGYFVEAMNTSRPITVGGQIFTKEWRRVAFNEGKVGVPIGRPFEAPILRQAGLVDYLAAQALRWWFHAVANSEDIGGGICLKSRIVKCTIKYSLEVHRESEHCEIGGDDRSNYMPDWGTQK